MGFREDVPMDDFIRSSGYLRDALGHAFGVPESAVSWSAGGTTNFMLASPSMDQQVYPDPQQAIEGHVTRSTCLELEPWPTVVWDVNGYYLTLGVGFRATRRQLRQAYAAVSGQDDDYLTYVFRQLLDPGIRRLYDACPLGTKFFDRYVEEELKRRARQLALIAGRTPEEILSNWGFVLEDDEADTPQENGEVDKDEAASEDEAVDPSADQPDIWPYTYFVWRLKRRDDVPSNVHVMRRWQEAIVTECQRRRVAVSFGVGLMGQSTSSRILTMSVEGATVVFISVDHIGTVEALEALAPYAVDRLIQSEN